jgi:hypothetical protein
MGRLVRLVQLVVLALAPQLGGIDTEILRCILKRGLR